MEQSKQSKPAFGQVAKKNSWEQLQQLNYIKIKVIFQKPDKSLRTLVYKCSAKQTLYRFINALRLSLKLKQNEALFVFHRKKVVDKTKTLADLTNFQNTDIIVLDAATEDIF